MTNPLTLNAPIDTLAMEVFPCEDPEVLFPVHMIQIRDMGLTQGQNFDLEGLAALAKERPPAAPPPIPDDEQEQLIDVHVGHDILRRQAK